MLSLGLEQCLLTVNVEKQLLASSLEVETRLVEPRVRTNLINRRTKLGIIVKECENEVLKLFRESLSIHFVEVEFSLTCDNQVVEILFSASLFEGEDAMYDDE
jgi:hypothetical protein